MAMTKPIALSTVAFDSTSAHLFYFTSSGGNQVVKNKITIRNNSTNAVVYQNTVESFLFRQEVPAGTLTNGVYYNFYFNTYDIDNNESPNSNVVAFYCYSTPIITLTNAPLTNRIENSSYEFTATYNQAQGELLDYLVFYLYDSLGNEISNSGNLYSSLTPPLSFSHEFQGFMDAETYSMQIKAISINGTQTQSELYEFLVQYAYPNVYSLITLDNKCDEGYVQIRSNVILSEAVVDPNDHYFLSKITDGNDEDYIKWDEWYTIPETDIISQWAERYAVDITYGNTLTWHDGISIPSSFQLVLHMQFHEEGKVVELFKTGNESNKIYIEIKRGIPYGETTEKCWFIMYSQDGRIFQYSNFIDVINGNDSIVLFVNKVLNVYTLTIALNGTHVPSEIIYNTSSNVEYGVATDIAYIGMTAQSQMITSAIDINDLFPIDNIIMYNGKFDNIDVSVNTDRVFSLAYPTWDFYTRLNSDFSTLNGGNINMVLSQTEAIRIKRRTMGSFDWITLYDVPITDATDLNIAKYDCGVPTNESFEYAIVPVMSGGIEGNYIISEITTNFRWCYLCNGDNILKFYSNVSYQSTSNPTGGIYAPLGRVKPITVYNSVSDYENGTFSGDILGNDFLEDRIINRRDIVNQVATYKQFINNKKPKFLKDWNGRIKIVDTNVNGNTSESVDLISGKANLSFTWVDKGEYDNQSQLEENGLV